MIQRRLPTILLLASVFTAGCEQVRTPTEATSTPLFGKPAPVEHPNALWVWHRVMSDNTAASKIFGDGRLENGAPALAGADSRYEGGKCGVLAQIRPGADGYGGDAPFDPDYTTAPAGCGGKREIIFDLSALGGNAATRSVADTWVHRLNRMTVGDTIYRVLKINNVPMEKCTSIEYGVPNSSAELLDDRILSKDSTNTAVIAYRESATKWTLETINNGQAQCSYVSKNKTYLGVKVKLPFRATITQVP